MRRAENFLGPEWQRLALAYALVALVLVPFPLIGMLHVESAAIVAAVAFFLAGVDSLRAFRHGGDVPTAMRRHSVLLAIPALVLASTAIWRPNCDIAAGAGLFALFTVPSALLGVSLAFALHGTRRKRPVAWLICIGLCAIVGGVLSDLALRPQLFTYNHVFGGVLGPVYDEELSIRPGLFVFRGLTLLWSVWLLAVGFWAETRSRSALLSGALASVLIGLAYLFSVPLGFQQSESNLARELGGVRDHGDIVIHFDSTKTPPGEVDRILDEALYRSSVLEERLDTRLRAPVHIYAYPDAQTKGALLGSRETSVVPVWLRTPQVHMLVSSVERSLGHELVHVYAREFGMPLIHASPSIGLIEGLAVALEPPDGMPTAEALTATLLTDSSEVVFQPADVVASTMRPFGFWTARAGVAYTVNGAFVAWLLERFGPDPVKRVYGNGDFAEAFGLPADALATEWVTHLRGVEVSEADLQVAAWLFQQPSLFEVGCPHFVPPYVRWSRYGAEALRTGRPASAQALFAHALRDAPSYEPAVIGWVGATAAIGATGSVRESRRFAALAADSSASVRTVIAAADLLVLAGDRPGAQRLYQKALDRLSPADYVNRALLTRRMAAPTSTIQQLSAAVANPERSAQQLAGTEPVWSALLFDQAFQSAPAWREAQRWCTEGGEEDRAALTFLKARIAYRADAFSEANAFANAAAMLFEQLGAKQGAALALDLGARTRWALSGGGAPSGPGRSIFGAPDARPDAFLPACPAPDRLRFGAPVLRDAEGRRE